MARIDILPSNVQKILFDEIFVILNPRIRMLPIPRFRIG